MSQRQHAESRPPHGDRQLVYAALVLGSLAVVVTCGTGTLPTPTSPSAPPPPNTATAPTSESSTASPSGSAPETAAIVQEPAPDPTSEAAESAVGPFGAFRAALRELKDGKRKRAVRVTWLGDSHTAADFWTDAVRQRLNAASSPGGPGFVYLGLDPYRHSGYSIERDGDWQHIPGAPSTSSKTADGVFGIGGVRTSFGSGDAKLTLTPRSGTLKGSARWTLFFRMPDASTRFRVKLGDKSKTVRAKHAGRIERTLLEGSATESLVIEPGSGRPELFGAVLEGSEPGVVLDTLGINGARVATALAWDEEAFVEVLKQREPDLVILAYGTNEAGANYAVEKYRAQFESLMKRVRRAAPEANCALFGPTDWVKNEERVIAIDQLERSVAASLGCGYFSVFDAMGGRDSITRWAKQSPPLAAPDHVHLTPKGYQKLGDASADFLLGN
ncbi:MAG: GDSL-type esterase/lipase family protein [Polyangiaceae bacterium]